MGHFRGCLGLEKKKEKVKHRKQAIDLGGKKEAQQDYRCNAYNIGKITKLKQADIQGILAEMESVDNFWRIVVGKEPEEEMLTNSLTHKLSLFTKNVYLCGRYIKFSRYLSQTPWAVNGQRLTEGSLQE